MTDDAPQREPGWYWVRWKGSRWVPAGYDPQERIWWQIGRDLAVGEHEIIEVGPRMRPPGEPAPKAEASNRGHFEDHLSALRDANAGAAVTVWKDGSWQAWQTLDAKYAEGDPNWLCTIPFSDAIGDAFDIVRATAIAAVRREATSAERERCIEALRTAGAALVGRSRAATFYEAADYLAANKPQDITPARDPVALLLAEAARLAKSDDLEDQRRARGLQDAAKLLGGGE